MWPALLACEQAHFDLVAGTETRGQQQQKSDPWLLLKSHVRAHRREFVDLRKGLVGRSANHDHEACVGYVNEAPDGSNEFLFSNDKLREICGSHAALLQLKQKLSSDGMLLVDEHRLSVRRTIWENGKREQVIAIRARAFSQKSASASNGALSRRQDARSPVNSERRPVTPSQNTRSANSMRLFPPMRRRSTNLKDRNIPPSS